MKRQALIKELAAVSHDTYMRQKAEQLGLAKEDISSEVTDHDLERARDTVAKLEELGVLTGIE